MASRPKNFIMITSDEMRGDCPGFMGNSDCRTPALDAFAQRSVVFNNHYAVHGKCVPSRVAMVTGRYSHTDGFRTITQLLPNDQPDLGSTLKRRGYETAVFGVNHTWENFWGDNTPGSGFVDYTSYTHGVFRDIQDRRRPVQQPGHESLKPLDLPEQFFEYGGRIVEPLTGFCDDARAEQAVEYLTRVRDRSRPFFMQVNIGAPHPSYQVEEPYYSMYDRDRLRAWPHELPENAPLHMRKMREIRTGSAKADSVFREIQAVYYGMITKVDVLMKQMLDAIEQEGLLEDTLVMFTVDHGDFAGQYGLIEKWDTAMGDCILHVPMVLWAPNLPHGVRVESLSEHTDLAPTVMELLGLSPDWGLHGRSLLPIIRGEDRKDAVFADGGHEDALCERVRSRTGGSGKQQTYQLCPDTMARTKMVRTDTWKLVMRLRGGNELYDMVKDPYELHNLWGRTDLTPVVLDLQQRLIEWCLRTDTDRPNQAQFGA
jgi:choline-sulfatase